MIERDLLERITSCFKISDDQLKPVSGGHFAWVYEFQQGPIKNILRIIPPNQDVNLQSMQAITEWQAFLADQGGPVVKPVRSTDGRFFEVFDHQDQVYIASVTEKAPGILAETMTLNDWNDALLQTLGSTLGLCHRLAQNYTPLNPDHKLLDWDSTTNCFNPKENLAGADPVLIEKRERLLANIRQLPKNKESYGLVHMDLHFGNFFVDAEQDKITLFDFDDCAYGWFVMDIAMLLFDVLVVYDGQDVKGFGEYFLRNLLRGYGTQRELDNFWVSELPRFLKLLEIGLYLMLYREYDPGTADWWVSKFMPGRRERITQEKPYVEIDFLFKG